MKVPDAWKNIFQKESDKPYFSALMQRVAAARSSAEVYPPAGQEYAAFAYTPPEAVRVVILGQDPYHEPAQAMGLAFSVADGQRFPPSLCNLFKELQSDCGAPVPASGDLTPWAKQGVLLLNTVLSVERGKANSHAKFGWQQFTDAMIAEVSALPQPMVFVLWGAQAQKKTKLLRASPAPRLILSAPHPSPLSAYRGFFGSRPFSQINTFLVANGQKPIDWSC